MFLPTSIVCTSRRTSTLNSDTAFTVDSLPSVYCALFWKTENKLPSIMIPVGLKVSVTEESKASAISCMQSWADSSLRRKIELNRYSVARLSLFFVLMLINFYQSSDPWLAFFHVFSNS